MAEKWHYTSMTRSLAEHLLVTAGSNGAFLVRDSESVAGASVLSVGYNGQVHHYRLRWENGGVRMEGESLVHENLTALVAYCRTSDALITPLGIPIELSQEADQDDDDEDDNQEAGFCSTSAALTRVIDAMEERNQDAFHLQLKSYILDSACDDSEGAKTAKGAGRFQEMVQSLSVLLGKELISFNNKLERMRRIFSITGQVEGVKLPDLIDTPSPPDDDSSVTGLVSRLKYAGDLLQDTKKQVEGFLAGSTCEHTTMALVAGPAEEQHANVKVFAVKKADAKVGHVVAKGSKTYLTVNVSAGSVATGKGMGQSDDDKTYLHSQILQLIKSRSDQCRLGIKFEGKKRKDYVFSDAHLREDFCQMVQLMKNIYSGTTGDHNEKISVFIGTYNMGEAAPPKDLSTWFCGQGDGRTLPANKKHDVYAIGTQESAMSDKEWAAVVKRHVGPDYSQVALISLWQMRIVVFVKENLTHKISHVQTSSVATGIANALGNKGAVGVAMFIGGTSFCFVNCHLAAHAEKWRKRNANFMDIVHKLQLGQKKLADFDVTNQFHHLIWFGDLNYRINLKINTILEHIGSRNWSALQKADQLIRQRSSGSAFFGFEEGEITFPPTYRYERGNRDVYKWEKQKAGNRIRINVPSWCDRVLWNSLPNCYIHQTSYGCPRDIVTSDHSPVFATFDVNVSNQYVSRAPQGIGENCKIVFRSSVARLQTTSKTNFYLVFYGTAFQGEPRTMPNKNFEASSCRNTMPKWETSELPVIRPILNEREYLENEHLLVCVKSEDSDESYGEGCISLMWLFGDEPMHFACVLTHRGEYMGDLTGYVHITGSIGESKAGNLSIGNADDDDFDNESLASRSFRSSVGENPRPRSDALAARHSVRMPPVIPPKAKPESVKEWLTQLGLEFLTPNFTDNGFDELEFLPQLERNDLVEIGIVQEAHIVGILKGLETLRASSC